MESLNLKTDVLVQRLSHLERCGEYDEAIQILNDVWKDKSASPNLDGLSNTEAAELLLRCGSLIGFLGYSKQIPDFQENSRDLLTKARDKFISIYDEEKIAECENYLALTYTRKGETVDAQVWLDHAFSHNLPKSSEVRIYSHLIQSIITNTDDDYDETIRNFKKVESDFVKFGDDYLNGTVSSNLGIAHKSLGNTSESLKYFEQARYYHRRSRHRVYLGTVENNMAMLYLKMEDFKNAHLASDNAVEVFGSIKDKTKFGYSYDTKALIFYAEGKLELALEAVDKGIKILESSESFEYLVETLSTKIRILIKLNKITEASICLAKAINIAEVNISEKKALKLAADFAKRIVKTKAPVVAKLYAEKELIDSDIELVLPPELSHYEEIQGVWLKNDHLESSGLSKGSLAIVADEEIKRGDLVAVLERDSEDVLCGFYDLDFGIVCLEIADRKPQLFNEDEIQILGKIVGVAKAEGEDDKKMCVYSL